jgi:vacuolar-type H+-ATPase subunit D/Vma8
VSFSTPLSTNNYFKEILDLFDKEIEAETLSNIKKRLSDEVKKINRCVNDYLFDNDSIVERGWVSIFFYITKY